MSPSKKRTSVVVDLKQDNFEAVKKQCIENESSIGNESKKVLLKNQSGENIVQSGKEVVKGKEVKESEAYVWPPDEWYYEGEWEEFLAWKEEEEHNRLAREQRLDQQEEQKRLARKQKRNKVKQEGPIEYKPYSLVGHDSPNDEEYYTDEDAVESFDYDDLHKAYDGEKSPKFNF